MEVDQVTPRKRRVSRNQFFASAVPVFCVTPRKRRVSRNVKLTILEDAKRCHASQEACE